MKRTTIIEIICFLYAVLFLYTGIGKLIEYDTFKEQLLESPLIPFGAPIVAILIPLIEFLVVLCLVVPRLRLKGLYAAGATMVAFTAYIIGLMTLSDKLPCSCGGIISALSWQQHIVFNCAFIVLAGCGIFLQRRLVKENKKLWTSNISIHQNIAPKNI